MSEVIKFTEWNPTDNQFSKVKITKSGGKSVSICSNATKRFIKILTPSMMTWGISDFCNEQGEHNNKFSLTLNFPEFKTAETEIFLDKLSHFNEAILDAAVLNSKEWFDDVTPRDVLKYTFYPILKYPKIKGTKTIDYTRPPSISAKVECYDNKWSSRIFDSNRQLIFPSTEHPDSTPCSFVPKLSNVQCIIECGGIWSTGKAWGVTWRLKQCVVLNATAIVDENECQIDVPTPLKTTTTQDYRDDSDDDTPAVVNKVPFPVPVPEPKSEPVPEPKSEPVPEPKSEPVIPEKEPEPESEEEEEVVKKPVKKAIKKRVAAAV
jgi:hypothetical protein